MLTIPSSSFRAKFSSVTSPSLSPFLSPLSQTKFENWLKFGKTRKKLVWKIFRNFFSYRSQSKVVMRCWKKKNVFIFFCFFFNLPIFLKSITHDSAFLDPNIVYQLSNFGVLHTYTVYVGVWKTPKTSEFCSSWSGKRRKKNFQ